MKNPVIAKTTRANKAATVKIDSQESLSTKKKKEDSAGTSAPIKATLAKKATINPLAKKISAKVTVKGSITAGPYRGFGGALR